jgi:hypothetical protein
MAPLQRRAGLLLVAAVAWIPVASRQHGLLELVPLGLGAAGLLCSALYLARRKRYASTTYSWEPRTRKSELVLDLTLFGATLLAALLVWRRS